MHEDAMEFDSFFACVHSPTQHKSNITKIVAVYNADDMAKVPRIDERDKKRPK